MTREKLNHHARFGDAGEPQASACAALQMQGRRTIANGPIATSKELVRTVSRLVIGVGNVHRCDDGVGIHVVQRVRAMMDPGVVRVIESSGEGASLMDAWNQADEVILVDAVRSGSSPGRIHRLDAHNERLPSDFFHYSTHAFSVAEAIEMARALGSLPSRLVVYGIEGHDFSMGLGLSPAVAEVVDKVAGCVVDEFHGNAFQTKGDRKCTSSLC